MHALTSPALGRPGRTDRGQRTTRKGNADQELRAAHRGDQKRRAAHGGGQKPSPHRRRQDNAAHIPLQLPRRQRICRINGAHWAHGRQLMSWLSG